MGYGYEMMAEVNINKKCYRAQQMALTALYNSYLILDCDLDQGVGTYILLTTNFIITLSCCEV